MSNCNNNDAIIVNPVNNLKREFDDAAGSVPIVNADESFRIIHNGRNRNIYSNQEVTRGSYTSFGVPISSIVASG